MFKHMGLWLNMPLCCLFSLISTSKKMLILILGAIRYIFSFCVQKPCSMDRFLLAKSEIMRNKVKLLTQDIIISSEETCLSDNGIRSNTSSASIVTANTSPFLWTILQQVPWRKNMSNPFSLTIHNITPDCCVTLSHVWILNWSELGINANSSSVTRRTP